MVATLFDLTPAVAQLLTGIDAHQQLRARGHWIYGIVTTVLLPPTLVSGIFGMNVKDLPLTEGEGGFWWAIAIPDRSAVAVCLALKRTGLIGRR